MSRIYTDGSCRDKCGGWAWWNEDLGSWKSGHEYPSTNQRMELYAALDAINDHFTEEEITIISDSAYLVNCFGDRWWVKWLQNGWLGSTTGKEIINRDIWEPLLELVQQHGHIRFEKVKAHSGVYGNEKVDQMALREVQAQYGETAGKEVKGREGDGVHPSNGDAPGLPSSGVDEAEDARDPEGITSG